MDTTYLRGKRIFVVEDNLENRMILRIALAYAGAQTEFASSALNVVPRLREFTPVDVVLLDLMLPYGLSGYTVYEQIRATPEFAHVPIIACSAADPNDAVPRCKALGFNGFIPKPVDTDLLPDQIARVLSHKPIWATGSLR